jgi:hypothetical protein
VGRHEKGIKSRRYEKELDRCETKDEEEIKAAKKIYHQRTLWKGVGLTE